MVMRYEHATTAVEADTEEGRRPTIVPTPTAADPEMSGSYKRRSFTLQDKLRILAETDAAAGSGDIGKILRREGLYASALQRWREQRDAGLLQALAPLKRGPKTLYISEEMKEIQRLTQENAQLKERLARAETIIDFQKKVSELLAIPLKLPNNDKVG